MLRENVAIVASDFQAKSHNFKSFKWFIWFIPGALFPEAVGSKGISKTALKTPVLEQRQREKKKHPWQKSSGSRSQAIF